MFLFRLIFAALCCVCLMSMPARAQQFTRDPLVAQQLEASESFHRAVIAAGAKAVRDGQMRRADLIRLRVAMLSPSFRQQAEDLAVIQMSASGSDNVPIGDDGRVDRAKIDWEALAAFLEKLIPLILMLIDALSQAEKQLLDWVGLTTESWA